MTELSVVVCTYNRKPVLRECLNCLMRQDLASERFEIVVIDDGSSDGTETLFREFAFSGARYIRLTSHQGQSRAKNRGIREARGSVVVLIDSDIMAPASFLWEHLKWHRQDAQLIVDGPAINVPDVHTGFRRYWPRLLAGLDVGGAVFITANTSCRREHLLRAGLFDEDFGRRYGWQDQELGFRLQRLGLKRKKNRRAYAFHVKGRGHTEPLNRRCRKEYDRGWNAVRFYHKHPVAGVKRQVRFRRLRWERWIPYRDWEALLERESECKGVLAGVREQCILFHAYVDGMRAALEKMPSRKGVT